MWFTTLLDLASIILRAPTSSNPQDQSEEDPRFARKEASEYGAELCFLAVYRPSCSKTMRARCSVVFYSTKLSTWKSCWPLFRLAQNASNQPFCSRDMVHLPRTRIFRWGWRSKNHIFAHQKNAVSAKKEKSLKAKGWNTFIKLRCFWSRI